MKERPILFSAPMIRALLDGRKTQTRRVMKHQPSEQPTVYQASLTESGSKPVTVASWLPVFNEGECCICPYGNVGDQLWVRETWAEVGTMDPGLIVYRADYPACVPKEYQNVPLVESITWKPSIHMFREYSRIALEVTGVRVERLQNISEADAKTEGLIKEPYVWRDPEYPLPDIAYRPFADSQFRYSSAAQAYRALWDSINGNRPKLPHNPASARYARVKKWLDMHPDTTSWDANPWVWVVKFRRLTA